MSDIVLETTRKPSWLAWGSCDMNYSGTNISDVHTTANVYGYSSNESLQKETIREQVEFFEYRKLALLNYRNDLMNKLAECADKISEIDHEIKTINEMWS